MADDDVYIRTREALHALAEHVLSPAEHAAIGKIGLRQTADGFGTQPFDSSAGRRRLRVEGTELVLEDSNGERRAAITTLKEAAAFAEVEAGAPTEVYTPATLLDLDAPLVIDAAAAARLASWYALADEALERLRSECADEDPAVIQIWPEHFDLATSISQVNYGASPGDEEHSTPYLYVGPYEPPPPDGDYWNEPFGASVPEGAINDVDDAVAFFRAGRERLAR